MAAGPMASEKGPMGMTPYMTWSLSKKMLGRSLRQYSSTEARSGSWEKQGCAASAQLVQQTSESGFPVSHTATGRPDSSLTMRRYSISFLQASEMSSRKEDILPSPLELFHTYDTISGREKATLSLSDCARCKKHAPHYCEACQNVFMNFRNQSTSFLVWWFAMYSRIFPRSVWSMG